MSAPKDCPRCPALIKCRKSIVPGWGNPNARFVFVGQNPGKTEDAQGRPFVGPAGRVLATLIRSVEINVDDVFLTNAVRCLTPAIRKPKKDEWFACREFLLEELAGIKPQVIVALGEVATHSLYGRTSLDAVLGQTLLQEELGIPLIVTYHPSFLLRGQWSAVPLVLAHLEKAKRIVDGTQRLGELGKYTPVTTITQLEALRDYLLASPLIHLDSETTGKDWKDDELLCLSFATEPGEGWTVPVLQKGALEFWRGGDKARAVDIIGDILASTVPKALQNSAFDIRFFEREPSYHITARTAFGWRVNNLQEDTMLMHRLTREYLPKEAKPNELPHLLSLYSDMPAYEGRVRQQSKNKARMDEVDNDILWHYAAADSDAVARLVPILGQQLDEDGQSRWIYCVGSDTPVLGYDFRWRPAASYRVGDKLLSCQEQPSTCSSRKLVEAVVLHNDVVEADTYTIHLQDGRKITATPEHRWLVKLKQHGYYWQTTERIYRSLKDPRRRHSLALPQIIPVVAPKKDYDAGFLAAAFDSEGTLPITSGGLRLDFVQKDNALLAAVKDKLRDAGYSYIEDSPRAGGEDITMLRLEGGEREAFRFLQEYRPPRLFERFYRKLHGLGLHPPATPITITRIVPSRGKIARLSSSSGTYIAEGFPAHNTNISIPMVRCCQEMTRRGMLVDQEYFTALCEHYEKRAAELEKQAFEIAGREFNPDSPLQLQQVLFRDLGLPSSGRKTDSAAECDDCDRGTCKKHDQVSEAALLDIKAQTDHPIIDVLIEIRQVAKRRGTNLAGTGKQSTGFLGHIRRDGRIHAEFKGGFAETGRAASQNPNMQNVPKGVIIEELQTTNAFRRTFIAPPGHVLMEPDWSQAEVWVLAYTLRDFFGDHTLLDVLESGRDIHVYVGRHIWPVDPELDEFEWQKAHDDLRTDAKVFVFGIQYGLTVEGIMERLHCSKEEAQRLLNTYLDLAPGLRNLFDYVRSRMFKGEPMVNKFGRRRHSPQVEVMKVCDARFALEELFRELLNFLSQSGASDLHSLAHIATESSEKMREVFRIVDAVHDSCLGEVPAPDLGTVLETAWRLKHLWQETALNTVLFDGSKLGWQIPVEVKWGRAWGDMTYVLLAKGGLLYKGQPVDAALTNVLPVA